jgi:type VI secretion system protein VasD
MVLKRLGIAGLAGKGRRIGVLAGLLSSAVAACAHAPETAPPCDKPEPLRVALSASDRLNPDDKGAALATVVRLYQVKGLGKLDLAAFDDLLDHDKDTLGDDFLAVQELTINPGERLAPAVVRNPDAQYVVAVALFRRPTALTWRALKRLPAPDPQYCHAKDPAAAALRSTVAFALDDNRIEVR